jgi:ATP-dependent helicase/nuclease subunit A
VSVSPHGKRPSRRGDGPNEGWGGPGAVAFPPLPREMVLASAGSGKTYRLSSRLIALLAREIPPEAIWASTFTRKAAAEILERVLLRLARGALEDEAAEDLVKSVWMDAPVPRPAGFLSREHSGRLLTRFVRSLHRANIGTLDSFFVQVASSFSQELGLPPGWALVDGPVEEQLRAEALEAVLAGEGSATMAELVRLISRGEVRRGVHENLLDQVEGLLQLHRSVAPEVSDAWTPILEGVELEGGTSRRELEIRHRNLEEALAACPVPTTRSGEPNANWAKEIVRLAEAVRQADWRSFFAKGIGKKLVETGAVIPGEAVVFYRASPGESLAGLLDQAVAMARIEMGRGLIHQGRALGRLAGRYRQAFEEAQAVAGGFRFGDLTHLLKSPVLRESSDALYFRLDGRIRHLLLDEFQDTSLPQWEVMEPLVEELLAGGETERAAVVVADPKQSIYGWRGAQPELVDYVRARYGLTHDQLPKSWRSGPVILKAVAEVFQGLEANAVVGELEGGAEVARRWLKDFYPQEPSDPDLPGFVQLVAGPGTGGRGTVRPAVLDFAAALIGRLHAQEGRASIGVLVRTNRVVRYLIAALRRLDVPASGEGGTPLTDTAPVNALLALLRMADHPGDRLARYHVAQTPVGEVVEYTNHEAGAEANRLARGIRGRLMRDGYGATLDGWARALEPSCDALEWARLLQLVEMGFRWDPERTLRPGDFVRFVEEERVEDPSGAAVRVMTVHQAKGLEFDVVVLPHLYDSLDGRGSRAPAIPVRDPVSGRVMRIYPATDQATRALFPELQAAHQESRALGLRDELSVLYVAMTRARYALHMVVPADGERGPGTTKSPARILRAALAPGESAAAEGQVLYRRGAEGWQAGCAARGIEGRSPRGVDTVASPYRPGPVPLRPVAGARTRNLARRTPSSLEGGAQVDLASLMRTDLAGHARLRGTVVHAWCEGIEWMEDGLPDEAALHDMARARAPGVPDHRVQEWVEDFQAWMEAPPIRRALSRVAYPAGTRVERELPFLHRVPDGMLHGFIDRLVLIKEGGVVTGAEVVDFKTDVLDGSDPEAVAARVAYYRPQIDAYREAVAGRYGLELSAVSGRLLFLRPGVVREV